MTNWEDVETEVENLTDTDYRKLQNKKCHFCYSLRNETIKSAKVEKYDKHEEIRDPFFGRDRIGERFVKRQPMIIFRTNRMTIRKQLPVNFKFCPVCGRLLMEDKK